MLVLTEFCIVFCIYRLLYYTVKPSQTFLAVSLLSSFSSYPLIHVLLLQLSCSDMSRATVCKGCICVWECVSGISAGVHEGVWGCSQVKKWTSFPSRSALVHILPRSHQSLLAAENHVSSFYSDKADVRPLCLMLLMTLLCKTQMTSDYWVYCAFEYYTQYNII